MTYIIAEVGGNHDGDFNQAVILIYEAKKAGADAVKFQIYDAAKLVHPNEPALKQDKGYTKQIDRFRALEFSHTQWMEIIQVCESEEIDFMATCFDLETLELYEPYMKMIKISSGDLTYKALIRKAATYNKPVILSTGMATIQEIVAVSHWCTEPIFMHCVSSYPCNDSDVNIDVVSCLKYRFINKIGYSDHTIGITACIAAVALGASIIEKHFTLDKTRDWGDHPLSSNTEELAELVQHVQRIDKMKGSDKPSKCEALTAPHFRRGAYSATTIRKGELITYDNISVLRPATHLLPHKYVGKIATKDYIKGESLDGT